jgi:hypothetical protein
MPPVELLDNVMAKHVTNSSVVVTPALDFLFWVRPQKITKQSRVWHILRPALLVDNLQVIEVWAKTTMHADDPIVYNCCDWKPVKTETKLLPDSNIVPSLAFIIEAIHSVDGLALVVAS